MRTDPLVDRVATATEADTDIVALLLYGSRAKGTAEADSDYDFAVIYQNPKDQHSTWVSRAARLGIELTDQLGLSERTLSMIDINNAPYPVAFNALNGHVIWCRDPSRLATERVRVSALLEETYGRLYDAT